MGIFSVVPERLAVIGHHSDHRVVVESARPQLAEKFPDRGIRVRNLTVVGRRGARALVRFRRIEGMKRSVKMYPDKKWAPWMLAQPRQRMPHPFAAPALRRVVAIFSRVPRAEAGVVGIKSPVEAGSEPCGWVKDDRADKCSGVISVGSQDFRSIGQLLRQGDLEIGYLVKLRIRSGKEGGMRRRSQRDLRIRMGKNHGLACQHVQVWRQTALRAEEPHAVGANRVQSNKDDVGRRCRGRQGTRSEPDNTHQLSNQKHRRKVYHWKNLGPELALMFDWLFACRGSLGRFRSSPVRSRLAGLWMDEKRAILWAQNHILVTNDRTARAWTPKFNLYRKSLQIFRFPKSQLEAASSFRR